MLIASKMYKKLATLVFIFNTHSPIFADDHQNTIGHWRFDSEGSEVGSPITESVNSANPGTHDATLQAGNPLYSSDTLQRRSTTLSKMKF